MFNLLFFGTTTSSSWIASSTSTSSSVLKEIKTATSHFTYIKLTYSLLRSLAPPLPLSPRRILEKVISVIIILLFLFIYLTYPPLLLHSPLHPPPPLPPPPPLSPPPPLHLHQ